MTKRSRPSLAPEASLDPFSGQKLETGQFPAAVTGYNAHDCTSE